MTNVTVFVRYYGRWDQNNVHIDHETIGVLVLSGTTYIDLLNILFKAMKLRPQNHTIGIKYVVELRTFSIKILDDLAIDFYLELKKNEVDKTKFSLCLDIIEEQMSMIVEGSYTLTIQFK